MAEQTIYETPTRAGLQADSPEAGRSAIEVLTQIARRKWLVAKVTGISTLMGAILCLRCRLAIRRSPALCRRSKLSRRRPF